MVRALFRDIMNLLNLEGDKSCMIGSIVTAIFTHLIYFKVFYSYLQKSKVKSINYKNIPQGKAMKGQWSQKLKFGLKNGQKLQEGENIFFCI